MRRTVSTLLSIAACAALLAPAPSQADTCAAPEASACESWAVAMAELNEQALQQSLSYIPAFVEEYGQGSDECWLLGLNLLDYISLSHPVSGYFSERAPAPESAPMVLPDRVLAALYTLLSPEQLAELGLPQSAQAALAAQTAAPEAAEPEPLRMLVFHCPVQFNDGRPVPPELISKLEEIVCADCGGFTVSAVEGAWEDDGRVYREPMRRYLVGVEADRLGAFQSKIESLIKGEFAQLAVWFEVDGVPEIR